MLVLLMLILGGTIQVLMLNHDPQKTFTVQTCDRIAQIVFMEKFNANFHRVTDKAFAWPS